MLGEKNRLKLGLFLFPKNYIEKVCSNTAIICYSFKNSLLFFADWQKLFSSEYFQSTPNLNRNLTVQRPGQERQRQAIGIAVMHSLTPVSKAFN